MYESCADDYQTKRYFEERNKLNELLVHEEAYRKQRAKSFWLLDGDSNFKFFHAYATSRKKKSSIYHLRNEEGELVSDQEGMKAVVKDYFLNLFSHGDSL